MHTPQIPRRARRTNPAAIDRPRRFGGGVPLVVFFLRVTDVTMATIRMLMIMRGRRFVAPMIGFVEILLWVTAVGIVVQHLDSPLHVVGYAAGFATGNFLGLLVEERPSGSPRYAPSCARGAQNSPPTSARPASA